MSHPEQGVWRVVTTVMTALACALALGALWSLLDAWWWHAQWLVFGIAATMALAVRLTSQLARWVNALLAALGTLLAACYHDSLTLAQRIAVQFGLTLWDVLRASGPDNLGALAWRMLPDHKFYLYLIAALFAAIIAWWLFRPHRSHDKTD